MSSETSEKQEHHQATPTLVEETETRKDDDDSSYEMVEITPSLDEEEEKNGTSPNEETSSKEEDKEETSSNGGEVEDENVLPSSTGDNNPTTRHSTKKNKAQEGLWIGIDLGTSNCAAAVWDSTRGRPKWMRLQGFAVPPQSSSKAGRIVPSAVQLLASSTITNNSNAAVTLSDVLWQDIQKWNPYLDSSTSVPIAIVGHQALTQVQQQEDATTSPSSSAPSVMTSMKRVLGLCDTKSVEDLDSDFLASLPFALEETEEGQWVIPYDLDDEKTIFLRPVHVAAMVLHAIRQSAKAYLPKAVRKKKMQLPGLETSSTATTAGPDLPNIANVVIGVPAYFGQTQRQAVEEAARLAGFEGHVSTLTESTAAAMAYGLFVGQPNQADETDKEAKKNAILVLDMGGGTTDITIAQLNNRDNDTAGETEDRPDQKFQVILTDGDSRLGGEDMDQALLDLVVKKALSQGTDSTDEQLKQPDLSPQQRQYLMRSCQQSKEELCGDVDHGDPPAEMAIVNLPEGFSSRQLEVTTKDLEDAIRPLLDRTAQLVDRALQRHADKQQKGTAKKEDLIREVILIGGATRVPGLRRLLKERFFPDLELCTSVNAMSAVAQGTAIQAAIVSNRVPPYELRSAMMLDTMPHSIGVLLPSGTGNVDDDDNDGIDKRFVEILPRDSSLPASGYTTFYVADLDQKGVTVSAVELIEDHGGNDKDQKYQPLGDFTFLLHRLSEAQREAIRNDPDRPGLRPVDIGMTLSTDGAFQVTIFDFNDPDHRRKKEFYEKAKRDGGLEAGFLDYVQAAADLQSDGITAEEVKLLVVILLLFVFYIVVKVLLPSDEMAQSDEGLVRIV